MSKPKFEPGNKAFETLVRMLGLEGRGVMRLEITAGAEEFPIVRVTRMIGAGDIKITTGALSSTPPEDSQ